MWNQWRVDEWVEWISENCILPRSLSQRNWRKKKLMKRQLYTAIIMKYSLRFVAPFFRRFSSLERKWVIRLIRSTQNELIIQLRDAVIMLKLTRIRWHWFHLQLKIYMNNSSVSTDSIIMCLCHFKHFWSIANEPRHNVLYMWPGFKCARLLNHIQTHNPFHPKRTVQF